MNINAVIPDLIIGFDENIYTLMGVRRSVQSVSLAFDCLQCIDEALQKRFILPRTVISLFRLRPADVPDKNARGLGGIVQPSAEHPLLGRVSHLSGGCIILRFTRLMCGGHGDLMGDEVGEVKARILSTVLVGACSERLQWDQQLDISVKCPVGLLKPYKMFTHQRDVI